MFTLDYKCFKFKRFFNWLIRVLCCPGTVCVLKCMWLKYFLYIHTRKVRTCTSFEVFGIEKAQLLTHPRLLPGSKILTKVWFCTYFTITINIRQNSTFRSTPFIISGMKKSKLKFPKFTHTSFCVVYCGSERKAFSYLPLPVPVLTFHNWNWEGKGKANPPQPPTAMKVRKNVSVLFRSIKVRNGWE